MSRSLRWIALVLLTGCAGMQRDCSSCSASSFGSDWIIVQYRNDGVPINCWQLRDTAVDNESQSDGIYWKSPAGHLVHISGWYNRVQVSHGDFKGAAKSLDVNLEGCADGRYVIPNASASASM